MVIIFFFDQLIDGFWQCWLFWTSWFFFDQWGSSWPVWTVLISFMGWDHVVGLTNSFLFFSSCPWFWTSWLFLTFAMVSDQFDWYWFRPCCWLDWWFLTFLTMLMVFDHVDGSGPVDCFRPMGWFLTILNGFDQCYGFTPCCWSYLWIFFSFLTMLMIFHRSMVLDQLIVFDQCDGFWTVWTVLISVMG